MAFRRWFPSKQTRAESRRIRRAARKSAAAYSTRFKFEALEERRLMTTLHGGDSFEYFDDRQQIIRIRLDGNITAEIIGSVVNPRDNTVTLGPLRGDLAHPDGTVEPIAGGLVQTSALQLFGNLGTITDPNAGVIPNETIGNLAATNSGQLYAVGSHPVGGGATVIDVIQFTLPPAGNPPIINGTVVASFTSGALGVTLVNASDFDPGTGRLFFVGNSGDATDDILFSVDVSLGSRAAREGSIDTVGTFVEPTVGNPPAAQAITITGITFTGAGAFSGVAQIDQNQAGGGGGGGGGGNNTIFFSTTVGNLVITPGTINVLPAGNQQGGGGGGQTTPATDVNSIEAAPGGGFIALGRGGGGAVYSVDANGTAVNLGNILQNGQDTSPGANITGLTFLPNVLDPFTNRVGAFIAFDGVSRQFFFVDTRNQNPIQNLWSIYISQSDVNASIAAGFVRTVGDTTTPPGIKGTQGNTGELRVFNAQNGLFQTVNSGDETGQAFLGARTVDIGPDPNDDLRPVVTAQTVPPDIDFGVLPTSFTTMRPGVYMGPGNDLGKFLWGGTITGAVDLAGSIDTFYAGWLLTGDARGLSELGATSSPLSNDSFHVDGDLRNLIVKDSIGTDNDFAGDNPTYVTGFNLQVNGTLGQVNSEDTIVGNAQVGHLSNAPSLTNNQRETEDTHQSGAITDAFGLFDQFLLGGPAIDNVASVYPAAAAPTSSFYNDSFWTAQRLNSFTSSELNRGGVVRVDGVLQNDPALLTNNVSSPDPADYYALPLMAGQSVAVKLDAALFGALNVGVFDPDGRIIATDYTIGRDGTSNQTFRFTADRPGLYRFAVGVAGDTTFSTGTPLIGDSVAYTLNITNVGDVSLGAITANRTIYDLPGRTGFRVLRGDFGALETVAPALAPSSRSVASDATRLGRLVSQNQAFGLSMVQVDGGNLRTLDAGFIGELFGANSTINEPGLDIVIDVPQGSVGLVRARAGAPASAGNGDYGGIVLANPFDQTRASGLRPIGGDYQLIDAPRGFVRVDIAANRGLGVMRARSMATLNPSQITLNADNTGRDGVLDLMDVSEDLGTLGSGGPAITTNEGGNVRYIRVLGTVYQDVFFGGGQPTSTVIQPGQNFSVNDDSGAVVKLRPLSPVVRNPNFDPQNPNGASEFLGTSMLVTTYGIRGSGGSAIVNVSAVNTLAAGYVINDANPNALATDANGIEISASGDTPAEIGRVEVTGAGTPVVFTTTNNTQGQLPVVVITGPDGRPRTIGGNGASRTRLNLGLDTTAALQPLEVRLTGTSTIDVLNVVVTGADLTTLGNASVISNDTPDGEIANVTAQSVGRLFSRGTIGMTKSHTGTAVEGIEDLTIGNTLAGDAGNVVGTDSGNNGSFAGGIPIGNGGGTRLERQVYTSRSVTFGSPAGNDQQFLSNVRNGVVVVGGNIGEVSANEGIANIFVQGSIGTINADADGVDQPGVLDGIRGPIATFSYTAAARPVQSGRILNVNIGDGIAFGGTGDFVRAGLFAYGTIGPITGNDGADIRGPVHSRGWSPAAALGGGDGTLAEAPVTALGRTTQDGSLIQGIRLRNGSIIDTAVFVTSARGDVRPFDKSVVIPEVVTDTVKNPLFDIGPITLSGNGGVIGSSFVAADISKVTVDDAGFGIFSSFFSTLGDGRFLGVDAGGYGVRGTVFNGGASISSLIAEGDGSSKSTTSISPSVRLSEGNVPDDALFRPIAGETPVDPYTGQAISLLTDIHTYLGTSAAQPEIAGRTDTGVIEGVDARGQRDLDFVSAWQIRADGRNGFGNTLLNFANSIGTLTTKDVIDGLDITTGSIKAFNPGSDVLNLDMTVAGPLKKLTINGNLRDNSVIRTQGKGGAMGTITIAGDLSGALQSGQSIKKLVVGRNFSGRVSANNSGKSAIGTLQVNGALTGSSLQVDGNVGKIIAGQLGTNTGDKLTINGSAGTISVLGDMRASLAVGGSLKSLSVNGSIFSGGQNPGLTIDIDGPFGALTVGGNVEQGVLITPQPKKLKVGGQFAGTFA